MNASCVLAWAQIRAPTHNSLFAHVLIVQGLTAILRPFGAPGSRPPTVTGVCEHHFTAPASRSTRTQISEPMRGGSRWWECRDKRKPEPLDFWGENRRCVALSNDISPIFQQIERSNVVNLQPAMHSGVCFRRQIRQSTGVYTASTIVPWTAPSESRRCFCYSMALVVLASAWSISNTASLLKAACVCECCTCVAALV